MKTTRSQLNLSLFVTLLLTLGFGYMTYQESRELQMQQSHLANSLAARHLSQQELKPETIKTLESFIEADRHKALSDFIQAANANNPKLLKKRRQAFQKLEDKYFKIANWRIQKLQKNARFDFIVTLLIPLIGLTYAFTFMNSNVFSPLYSLSKRMIAFDVDQYSYKRSFPKNNEIGNLERTFNALAERVLNNIDELKSLDRAKSEFVSIASHELRTPLTSIKGSLGLLSSGILGELDKESKEMIFVAEQETDRLVRLINDLLDLAKMEAKSVSLDKKWATLQSVFKTTAKGIEGFANTAKVKIKITEDVKRFELFADADRVQQVMTNLISNAIKYSPADGTVLLGAQVQENGHLQIQVIDQGPGISKENQASIFEKFRQATKSSSQLVKGTGLGLAISKAIVEEHGGEIGVTSELGQGSTFYFSLPEWKPLETKDELPPLPEVA